MRASRATIRTGAYAVRGLALEGEPVQVAREEAFRNCVISRGCP